jgi:hypothetical protein
VKKQSKKKEFAKAARIATNMKNYYKEKEADGLINPTHKQDFEALLRLAVTTQIPKKKRGRPKKK